MPPHHHHHHSTRCISLSTLLVTIYSDSIRWMVMLCSLNGDDDKKHWDSIKKKKLLTSNRFLIGLDITPIMLNRFVCWQQPASWLNQILPNISAAYGNWTVHQAPEGPNCTPCYAVDLSLSGVRESDCTDRHRRIHTMGKTGECVQGGNLFSDRNCEGQIIRGKKHGKGKKKYNDQQSQDHQEQSRGVYTLCMCGMQ